MSTSEKYSIKYKEGNNRPSAINLTPLVHKHITKLEINVTLKTIRTLGKTQVCE